MKSHGQRNSRLYVIWRGMKSRCVNKNHPAARNYSERGITIEPEWFASFSTFADAVGQPPSPAHQIDRIDNARGYEPGNVRWVTARENSRNRRGNVTIAAFGQTLTVIAWAEKRGIKPATIYARLKRGLAPAEALFARPLSERPRKHGTRRGYDGGCRCTRCRSYNAARARERRHRNATAN